MRECPAERCEECGAELSVFEEHVGVCAGCRRELAEQAKADVEW